MLDLLPETGKLGQIHVAPLWNKAYILLDKTNCLGTLRDIETGWLVELPYSNTL